MKKSDSKKMIKEFGKEIRELPATPEILTYGKLYQALQELHFQGRYDLVKKICSALMDV